MKSSSQLRETMAELREELDAIVAVSEREERDLSEEESTRCSEISEKLIPTLNKQMKTALSIERERNTRMESRTMERIEEIRTESGRVDASADKNVTRFGAIKIPAKAKNHGPLKAYQGRTQKSTHSLLVRLYWLDCMEATLRRDSVSRTACRSLA